MRLLPGIDDRVIHIFPKAGADLDDLGVQILIPSRHLYTPHATSAHHVLQPNRTRSDLAGP